MDCTAEAEARFATRDTRLGNGTKRDSPTVELAGRIDAARQRVRDIAANMRSNADALIGEEPASIAEQDRPRRSQPLHGGILGEAFSELVNLEEAIEDLSVQVARLNPLV